jgi:hypothetical protein
MQTDEHRDDVRAIEGLIPPRIGADPISFSIASRCPQALRTGQGQCALV